MRQSNKMIKSSPVPLVRASLALPRRESSQEAFTERIVRDDHYELVYHFQNYGEVAVQLTGELK